MHEIDERAVRQELWLSFASVLRSYLAVASLARNRHATLVTPTKEVIEVIALERTLRLTIEEAGTGCWSLSEYGIESVNGTFFLLLDGTVSWSELAHFPEDRRHDLAGQEMDSLAITLADRLFQPHTA